VKSYNKTRPIHIKEFDAEKAWWGQREENKHSWRVPLQDIIDRNYNLDIKNPHEEADDLGTPEELLAEYQQAEQDIRQLQDKIVAVLQNALQA